MPYIGTSPSNGVRRVHTYTATASQTTFSGAGAEGTSLSYKDSNYVDVYQNGIKLGDADYTSTSGTSIVLAQGASVDDLVVVVVFDVFSVADTVSKADGGTFDGIISTSSAGTNNLRIGANAGDAIASGGNYNVVLGDEAGTAITTGDNNVAVGYNALATNTTASTNTAVGYQAAYSNQTGVGLTAFGANALYSTTASDNCGIGTDNPGNYAAALENNTTGRFNTAVATGALGSNTEGNYNTAVGHSAGGSVTTGDNNVAVGFEALTTEDTGQNNVAIGYRAMKVANYDGAGNNVAVGADAGLSMTTGIFNTFVGAFAGDAHTVGYNNVAIGTNALGADVSSRGTIAIGAAALSSQNTTNTDAYNVAVGFGAGADLTTGERNVLLGAIAGEEITDADDCVGIGFRSCGGNAGSATTGHDNICIGTDSGEALTSGNKNCFMGKGAGNVYTTGYQNICVGHGSDGSAADRYLEYVIGVDCTSAGYDGLITIGVSNGSDRIYNNFKSNATWTRVSDERYKKDITDNTDCGLDFINDLRPRTFKWKPLADVDETLPDYDPTKTTHSYPNKHYGLIAQEVKATLEAHNITDFGGHDVIEDSGIQAISEQMFVHPLIKAVQELSAKVTALETENATQATQIADLISRVTALENAE